VTKGLQVTGLFAGIGGLELGLCSAGHESLLLVENFQPASHVLRLRMPAAKIVDDVRDLGCLPVDTDLVVAGFPCQDLSSVGPKIGIEGTKSSLVGEVFRLLSGRDVPHVLLENVPFLLDLNRGSALRLVTTALEQLGYSWAYRVVDAQSFGLPQRRRRWILFASRDLDPRAVLLVDESVRPAAPPAEGSSKGFYWTEGKRALGWAIEAVPPLKVGSSVGVASPPAIYFPTGDISTPDIRDAERLQGFPVDWTAPAADVARRGIRWRLVGNAVSVPVSSWLGRRIAEPGDYCDSNDPAMEVDAKWPKAAWNLGGGVHVSHVGDFPVRTRQRRLSRFLRYPTTPLSARAASGFLARAHTGTLRFEPGFLEAVQAHIDVHTVR
jgi:DNA (cytosine-5)-methyltransferase 1